MNLIFVIHLSLLKAKVWRLRQSKHLTRQYGRFLHDFTSYTQQELCCIHSQIALSDTFWLLQEARLQFLFSNKNYFACINMFFCIFKIKISYLRGVVTFFKRWTRLGENVDICGFLSLQTRANGTHDDTTPFSLKVFLIQKIKDYITVISNCRQSW